MNLKQFLSSAYNDGVIDEETHHKLLEHKEHVYKDASTFKLMNIIQYLGVLIAMAFTTGFFAMNFGNFGWGGILFISILFAMVGFGLAERSKTNNEGVTIGIWATLGISSVPLMVYSVMSMVDSSLLVFDDYHRIVSGDWLLIEFATLVAAFVAFKRYSMPFLMLPVALTLWYFSMDVSIATFSSAEYADWWDIRRYVSLVFGIGMLVWAFQWDVTNKAPVKDYPFWLYFFGVIAFTFGVSVLDTGGELGKFILFLISIAGLLLGGAIGRRVLVVFGGFGIFAYLNYLSWYKLDDVTLGFALMALGGIFIAWLGSRWAKNEKVIESKLRSYLPEPVRNLLEQRMV